MPTVYYRTEDPVEHLKIRVVVREIAKSRIYKDDGTKVQPFYNEMILSWQQKLYSPGEISDYLRSKDSRSSSASQAEARRHFAKLEKDGDDVKGMLEEVMMYTYVDKDNFKHDKPPPLMDPGTQEPYLGAAVRTLGGAQKMDAREKGIANRLFKDRPFKAMHICLATDVEATKLCEPASIWTHERHFSEHVLCSIKLYQDGLLEVSPSFSSVIEEAGFLTHDEGAGLSAFIDDHSAEAGIKKGFRLASFRVRSAKGSEFEYVVQNVNDILVPHKLEQIEAKKAFLNSIKAAEVRGAVGSEAWLQDPPSRDKVVGFYGEIVSGSGFEGEKLFLSYELTTPQTWLLRTGDLSDGVSNAKTNGKDAVSAEQQELRALGHKLRVEGDEGNLRGVTHTATVSQHLRTSTTLPLLRPRWKGVHVAFAAGAPTRIIVGTVFFGLSCFSIILGASYPFWIVPALVIAFVLGTGVPGQPQQVVLLKRKSAGRRSSANSARYALQPTYKGYNNQDRVVVGELEPPPVAIFNHLMRFSFDVQEADPKAAGAGLLAPTAYMPTLVFQVYSTDWLGRHRLEGYGYHHLSDQPGNCEVEIKTWKPVGRIRDQMQDFFLGNAVYLKDEHFVESGNKSAAALNRFGVLTQSSGSVRLRVHTIVTDPRKIEDQYRESLAQKQQADSSLKVKRTVNDILKSFRASATGTPGGRGALSASNSGATLPGGIAALNTPGRAAGKGGERQSMASIVGSLNSSIRDAKVNEILARARAKMGKSVGAGGTKPEGIAAAAPHRTLGPPTLAAVERLKGQLPGSSFGTPGGAAGLGPTIARAPVTPGPLAVLSTVDTPFAEAKQQTSYEVEPSTLQRQQSRPKNVPPLGGLAAKAEGRPTLAPVTAPGQASGRRSAGGSAAAPESRAGSGLPSTHSTARADSAQPSQRGTVSAQLLEPEPDEELHVLTQSQSQGLAPVQMQSARPQAAPSTEPTSARRHHRYDTPPTPSGDEDEAERALLGDTSHDRTPPGMRADRLQPPSGTGAGAEAGAVEGGQKGEAEESDDVDLAVTGSTVGPLRGFHEDDEEPPEDTPLLGTLKLD